MSINGSIPVIPTPFLNGKLHLSDFDRLLEKTSDYLEGYVVCGSTGEAPAMSLNERIETIQYFASKAPKDKNIVVGLGHTNLNEAVQIGIAAAEAGIKTALVPSPYYFPNSLQMVIEYIGKLAELTGLDIAFYDNPVTTKTHYTADELIRLAEAVPQVKAIKMTDHAFGKIRQLKEQTKLAVFGGDDCICFRAFEAGVDGNMIIAPIIYPEAFQKSWAAYQKGQVEYSFEIFSNVILPFISQFGPGDEVPTTKAVLHHLGIFSSFETRLPLLACDTRRMKEVMLGYNAGVRSIVR